MRKDRTKELVIASLMAALTCIATMVIAFPTPSLGYIHIGDCFVLLCGIILGPFTGGLAAGIGSMLSDAFLGYTIYIIPTFIIKFVTAMLAGFLFRSFHNKNKHILFSVAISGVIGEINMIFGYFINSIVQVMFLEGRVDSVTFSEGLTNAITSIPFNGAQALTGIVLAMVLLPLLNKVPDIHSRLSSH